MIVLQIMGWCLLAISALLLLLLPLPLTLGVKAGLKTESDIWISFAGLELWRKSAPRKPKKEKKEPPKKKEKTNLSQTVRSAVQMVRIVFGHLPKIGRRLRVKRLELTCIAADADAADCAMQYGTACSVLYPLIEYMRQKMRLSDKNTVLDIRCDFDRQEPIFTLESEISLQVAHLFYAGFSIIFQKIKEDASSEGNR
ncbi:MAG: hypothetical protein IKY33_02230 [Clostridia bacterium]|nr:hypothetical protein [Clostridia bacterium]